MKVVPGACRYCGCTESNPCTTETGEPCAWFDNDRTVCTAPGCIGQFHVDDWNARRRDFMGLYRNGKSRRKKSAA
jgi:hypothetical protein